MKNICLIILLLQASFSFGQDQFILSGNIVDQEGKPMLFGNVILKDFFQKRIGEVNLCRRWEIRF